MERDGGPSCRPRQLSPDRENSRQRQLLPTGQTTEAEAVGKNSKMEAAPG